MIIEDEKLNEQVEKALLQKCLEGDRLAIVFWLQNRSIRWGAKREEKEEDDINNKQRLADLINNPKNREDE